MKEHLKLFDFNPETIAYFERTKCIPVDFYSKDGQILIYKKDNATEAEVLRVIRFINSSGIYIREVDETLLLDTEEEVEVEKGPLSSTKLLHQAQTDALKILSQSLIGHIKEKSFLIEDKFNEASKTIKRIVTEFGSQTEFMNGIINILELLANSKEGYVVDTMIKRAIVAMSIKTRGLNFALINESNKTLEISNLMLSAFFCDISYIKMEIPKNSPLSPSQFEYISNHPLLSYMMIAPNQSINSKIKNNILIHHHPFKDATSNNSYPDKRYLITKLKDLSIKYKDNAKQINLIKDIEAQISFLESNATFNEDANIISIASAYSSLTSDTPWRKAFTSKEAIRLMINISLFNYQQRAFRDFLDNNAESLCNNEPIFQVGDYVVVAVLDERGRVTLYELAQIENLGHSISLPGLRRIGILDFKILIHPLHQFGPVNFKNFKKDQRHAYYDLSIDSQRQIVYLFNEVEKTFIQKNLSNFS